ncbi:MAG: hypothetical protein WC644_07780 [Ignavibacteria bacterium]
MSKKITRGFKYILSIFLLSLAFTGAECENILNNLVAGDVTGSWQLVKMEGNLQDVCLGEIATFNNGTAILRCPGATSITKSYTYSNNVLTYTSTGVSYTVSFTQVNGVDKMIFRASGIERVLTYDKYSTMEVTK